MVATLVANKENENEKRIIDWYLPNGFGLDFRLCVCLDSCEGSYLMDNYYGVSDEFIMYVIVPALVVVIGWSVSKLIEWRVDT